MGISGCAILTADDYAPTVEQVRDGWVVFSNWKRIPTSGRIQAEQEFERFIAEVERLAAEKAWDEGWNTGFDGRMLHDLGLDMKDLATNPHTLPPQIGDKK